MHGENMKTFEWSIDLSSASEEIGLDNIEITKFGDGYEQRKPKGIMPALSSWSASKTGKKDEIQAIYEFLLEHKGVKSFLWRCEDDEPIKKWVASGINRTNLGNGIWRISWKMREVLQ